jgi:hypothetical protein
MPLGLSSRYGPLVGCVPIETFFSETRVYSSLRRRGDGECLHESRMREICTSGSTRGEGCCWLSARFLLYSTVFPVRQAKPG